MSSKYDVVIIGGGLGGLECGAILSREGLGVCVLEKNPVIGGCLQSFHRRGHTLDTGIHYIGSMDDGQVLNQYFRYFGILPRLRLKRMDPYAFDIVNLGGREYPDGTGYDNFTGNFSELFPAERGNLRKYAALLHEIGDTISVDIMRCGLISNGETKYFGVAASDAIASLVGDEALRQALAGTCSLYSGMEGVTTLYHHGMINHSFIEGPYRLLGGSQQLADALTDVIRENGGEVLCGTEVTAINTSGRRISSIEINGMETIKAGNVISSLHPALTFDLMDKPEGIKKAYYTRLHSLSNSYGIFTVYLIMKKGGFPYSDRNHYIYRNGNAWDILFNAGQGMPNVVLLSMQATDKGQEHAGVVSLMVPMAISDFADWESTTVERRGEGYKEFKRRIASKIIAAAEERFPGISDAAEAVYTASPLTYRDYTATPEGSAYGIIKNCRSPLASIIPVRTKIENLLLTGQNLNVHGALGVTVTAALTCAELTGTEYLAKKIANA